MRIAAAVLSLLLVAGVSDVAKAYSVETGDFVFRPVVGANVNVMRLEATTRETPVAGMVTGIDFDYAIAGPWAITGFVRPMLSPGFVDTGVGLGAKYRFMQLDAPLVPYAGLTLASAFGAPIGFGDAHVNIGSRLCVGVDYFIMRDFALGFEVGGRFSRLVTPIGAWEASTDLLMGASWRF